jgi:hypothetical protein
MQRKVFKMSFPFILQGSNVTVVIGSKPYTISKSHITYQKVVDAIKANDWDLVKDIIEPKQVVLDFGKGNISVKGETLYWKDKEMHNALSNRMIAMLQEGFSVEPLANFMENLMKNPSRQAVQELYGFLEKNNLPITPDGCFLAYKRVRENFTDCHTGKMDNSVGQVVEMDRNEVDDNRNNTCSAGLHFCSEGYLNHFGGDRTVIVKINPCDVVSIPSDYDNAKGRTCRYEVIGEVGRNPEDSEEFTKPVQNNANSVKSTYAVKEGSSSFYEGYSAGYNDETFDDSRAIWDTDYEEGFDKGQTDTDNGFSPRYKFVPKQKPEDGSVVWPFARG